MGTAARELARSPARLCVWLIGAYRASLSPMLGARCRFTPTCSEYAEQAIRQRGVIRGLFLGLWRLARCQPLCRAGHDPVPHSCHPPVLPVSHPGR